MTQYVIIRTMICTECTEKRAKRVAEEMRKMGYDVVYGTANRLPDDDPEFTKAFYAALDIADHGVRSPAPSFEGGRT